MLKFFAMMVVLVGWRFVWSGVNIAPPGGYYKLKPQKKQQKGKKSLKPAWLLGLTITGSAGINPNAGTFSRIRA